MWGTQCYKYILTSMKLDMKLDINIDKHYSTQSNTKTFKQTNNGGYKILNRTTEGVKNHLSVFPPLLLTEYEDVVSFQGNGMLTFPAQSSPITIPWLNRVVFRTRDINGLLLNIELSSSINIQIEVGSTLNGPFTLSLKGHQQVEGTGHYRPLARDVTRPH